MNVEKIHLLVLQNEEHFGYMTYVDVIFAEADPTKLKVAVQYAALKSLLADERIALDQVHKSDYTAKLDLAEVARDKPIRGFFKVVKGQLQHFNPAVSDAAYRVDIINSNFSDITRLSDEKQSSAAVSFTDALDAASADITTLLMTDWVTEIKAKEAAYLVVKNQRLDETDEKTTLKMKDVRVVVDEAYNTLINRVNAFITIDGDADYADVVTKINNRIGIFTLAVAQRKGRKTKDDAAGEASV